MKTNEIRPGAKFVSNGLTFTVTAIRKAPNGRLLVLCVDHKGQETVFPRTQLTSRVYRVVPQWMVTKLFGRFCVYRKRARHVTEYYSHHGSAPTSYSSRDLAQRIADELNKP